MTDKKRPWHTGSPSKPIVTPDGTFPSVKEAAKALGVAPATIRRRLLAEPDIYYHK